MGDTTMHLVEFFVSWLCFEPDRRAKIIESTHCLPVRFTGHPFLHSPLHLLGLHLSADTIATRMASSESAWFFLDIFSVTQRQHQQQHPVSVRPFTQPGKQRNLARFLSNVSFRIDSTQLNGHPNIPTMVVVHVQLFLLPGTMVVVHSCLSPDRDHHHKHEFITNFAIGLA